MTDKPPSKTETIAKAENVVEFPQARFKMSGTAQALAATGHVNQRELTSICALTAYVAHNQNISEAVIWSALQNEFHVDEMTKLRRDDFERIIKYLVDLRAELLIN